MKDIRTPVAPRLKETLNDLARTIDREIPPDWGFSLFLFDGAQSNTIWISSISRDALVAAMQEFVRKQAS